MRPRLDPRAGAAAALIIGVLAAGPAAAHRLKLFAAVDGGEIAGSAYFTGGGRAAAVPVQVFGPDGTLLLTVSSGPDGGFRFTPFGTFDHRIVIDGGDGHRAEFVVTATTLPAAGGSVTAVAAAAPAAAALPPALLAAIEASVARQVRPLREALDAYEDRVRVADVVGGVGFIAGLFGIAAFLAGWRRRSGPGEPS